MLGFEKMYKEHCDMVYNLALNYVQQVEDAEEITQDVFIKIYHKQELFEQRSTLKTWIYRITINSSLDFIRKKRRRPLFQLLSPGTNDYAKRKETKHPGVLLEEKEAYDRLFYALNLLPSKQKTVILLLKNEGLSQKETSKILNMSVKGVESLFQRAKKNLSKQLKKESR